MEILKKSIRTQFQAFKFKESGGVRGENKHKPHTS